MSAKDVEELTVIREEKRTLSITVENLKSDLSQLQSKVKYLPLVSSPLYSVSETNEKIKFDP